MIIEDGSQGTAFAKAELERAGLFDEDADYGGMIADAVMELIAVFARQGHSGASAGMTLHLFAKLAAYEPITALTYGPEEWNAVGSQVWQNKRDSATFSIDGGKTHYRLGDGHEHYWPAELTSDPKCGICGLEYARWRGRSDGRPDQDR